MEGKTKANGQIITQTADYKHSSDFTDQPPGIVSLSSLFSVCLVTIYYKLKAQMAPQIIQMKIIIITDLMANSCTVRVGTHITPWVVEEAAATNNNSKSM